MTESKAADLQPVTPPITVEDLRQKALRIADTAEAEVRALANQRTSKVVLVGAVVFGVALSLAYFLGTRRR